MKDKDIRTCQMFAMLVSEKYGDGHGSQKKCADDLGVDAGTVSNWIHCRRSIEVDNREKICKLFNVKRKDLDDPRTEEKTPLKVSEVPPPYGDNPSVSRSEREMHLGMLRDARKEAQIFRELNEKY